MTKIIHRYILREIIPTILLGLSLFTFILILDKIFDLVNLYLKHGVSFLTILRLLGMILPSIFSLTVPMAILMGCLLSFGRLSEDGEITALRAAGQPLLHVIWPVLWLSLAVSALLVVLNSTVTPLSHRSFKTLYREILTANPLSRLEERTFMKLPGYMLYIKHVDQDTGRLHGVHIYKLTSDSPPDQIIARKGKAVLTQDRGMTLILSNGSIQQHDGSDTSKTTFTAFKQYSIRIPFKMDAPDSTAHTATSLRSMTTGELRALMADYSSKKLPTHFIQTEYHLRIIMAFTPLVFAVIGLALGIRVEKGGKAVTLGLSLLILFVYYLLLIGAISFGEKGIVPPAAALWMPNLLTGGTGLLLLGRVLKR